MKNFKLFFLVIISITLLAACGAKKTNTDETTTNNTTIQNETTNSTTSDMIILKPGEYIDLEPNREYVFGVDIAPGTYKMEIESTDGQVGSYRVQTSQECFYGAGSVSSGHAATHKVFDAYIFEEGFSLIFNGEFTKTGLHYENDVATGFDYESFCNS